MYKQSTFQACAKTVVGFRQNTNPDYPMLSDSLLVSDTGLFYQDAHPLLTIENIDQCARNYDHFNYPDWVAGTSYSIGNKVRFDGLVYESDTNNNQGNQPDTNPTQWGEVNLLSQFLISMEEAGINNVAKFLFIDKKVREITKSVFDNVLLFTGVGSLHDKVIKRDRFVGFAIELKDHNHLETIINRVGFQLTQSNPNLPVYVFHTSRTAPIAELTFNISTPGNFNWSNPVSGTIPTLKYHSRDYDAGGMFIIGYYEEDLTGQAINRQQHFGKAPCGSCNRLNLKYYQSWSKFMRFVPIEVSNSNIGTKGQMFDVNDMAFTYQQNWGLNLELTTKCDVSEYLCERKELFADAIYYSVAIKLLQMIAFNVRDTRVGKQVKQEALIELEREHGVSKLVKHAMKALSFDFSDMNTACLPCNQSTGIRRTSVWG